VTKGRSALLHGNPTWSFLYRKIINELRDQFRCIAPDYPGSGLSVAPTRYGFTPAEHADAIERFVLQLDLTAVTMMVQDWGSDRVRRGNPPAGPVLAVRHRQHEGFCRQASGGRACPMR
jgi:haloalkane dehalogenase